MPRPRQPADYPLPRESTALSPSIERIAVGGGATAAAAAVASAASAVAVVVVAVAPPSPGRRPRRNRSNPVRDNPFASDAIVC